MTEIFKAEEPTSSRIIGTNIDESRQLSVFEKKIIKTQEETGKILRDAEENAARLVEEARADADSIRNKAYKAGLEKGKEESLARLDQLYGSLANEVDTVKKSHAELINNSQTTVLDFTFKLTRLILGSAIVNEPSVLENHLNRILERLTIDSKVEITVSGNDYEIIEEYLRDSAFNSASGGYEIKVDPALDRGSIRVNTPVMGIDGTLSGMLRRVEHTVMDLLSEDE